MADARDRSDVSGKAVTSRDLAQGKAGKHLSGVRYCTENAMAIRNYFY